MQKAGLRGLNENTNGLVRQYLPKKNLFDNIRVEITRRTFEVFKKSCAKRGPVSVNGQIVPLCDTSQKKEYLIMYKKISAEYYENLMPYASSNEIQFLKNYLGINKEKCILEPMCGSGRILIPLLKLNYKVDGLDSSKNMLEICRSKLDKEGLQTTLFSSSIEMFKTDKKYDFIIIPLGSVQILESKKLLDKSIYNLKMRLKTNGRMLIEFTWLDQLEQDDFSTNMPASILNGIILERTLCKKRNRVSVTSIYKKTEGKKRILEKEVINFTLYTQEELVKIFEKNNLKINKIYRENDNVKFDLLVNEN